jgi:tetratricopeptide (TPR) repeat protein
MINHLLTENRKRKTENAPVALISIPAALCYVGYDGPRTRPTSGRSGAARCGFGIPEIQEYWLMKRFSLVLAWLCVMVLLPGAIYAQDVQKYVDAGIEKCELGKYDQALKDFNDALKLKPNDASLYDLRGMAYRCKNMEAQAIQDFEKAMQLDPKFGRPYRNRAMIYFDRGDFDKSLADLEKAKSLGYKVDPDFLKMVARKAAEKK